MTTKNIRESTVFTLELLKTYLIYSVAIACDFFDKIPPVNDRFAALRDATASALLSAPATTPPQLRQAVLDVGEGVIAPMRLGIERL